jgi:hypothetical protein
MRSRYGVLTNDSLILAAMNEYGIGCLITSHNSLSTSRRTSKIAARAIRTVRPVGWGVLDLDITATRGALKVSDSVIVVGCKSLENP